MLMSINKTLETNIPSRVNNIDIAELHFTEQGFIYISQNDGTLKRMEYITGLRPDMKEIFLGNIISSNSTYSLTEDVSNFNYLLVYKYDSINFNAIIDELIITKEQYINGFNLSGATFNINNTTLTVSNVTNDMYIGIIGMQ